MYTSCTSFRFQRRRSLNLFGNFKGSGPSVRSKAPNLNFKRAPTVQNYVEVPICIAYSHEAPDWV